MSSTPLLPVVHDSEIPGVENEDDGARTDNPLLNHVILAILFENVRVERDLKECRVVCKKWNLATIPFVRSAFTVTIYGNQNQLNKENSDPCKREDRRIENFVQVFSSNTLGIPFDKFKLGAFGTTDGAGREFLKICGETAKEIDFSESEESDRAEHYMIEDVSEVLKYSTKLKCLELPPHMSSKSGDVVKLFPENLKTTLSDLKDLTLFNNYPEERKKCCPTFLEELLEVAPNISYIYVHDNSHGIKGSDFSAEDVLTAIDTLEKESSIESLGFSSVTKEHIEMMQRMAEKPNRLKLKGLVFVPEGRFDEEFNLAQIKTSTLFKDSIEYLSVWDTVFNSFLQFPTMPRLESLSIAISEDFNSKCVDLSRIFPALEALSLTSSCWQDDGSTFEDFFAQSEHCLTVKSFHLTSIYVSLNSFNQILIVFPKLTELELDIKEPHGIEILMRIWTHMIQLESLDISFEGPMEVESLDCVFTGIPFQTLRRIEHVVNSQSLGELSPQLRKEIISYMKNQHCQGPSIGNLTNLRCLEFSVETEGDGNANDLTDLTAFLGLDLMPRLKHLTVRGSKITKAALDILEADKELESYSLRRD